MPYTDQVMRKMKRRTAGTVLRMPQPSISKQEGLPEEPSSSLTIRLRESVKDDLKQRAVARSTKQRKITTSDIVREIVDASMHTAAPVTTQSEVLQVSLSDRGQKLLDSVARFAGCSREEAARVLLAYVFDADARMGAAMDFVRRNSRK